MDKDIYGCVLELLSIGYMRIAQQDVRGKTSARDVRTRKEDLFLIN